mgnify:CR=1 FL=1
MCIFSTTTDKHSNTACMDTVLIELTSNNRVECDHGVHGFRVRQSYIAYTHQCDS